MHDTEYFKKLAENIIMWCMIMTIGILAIIIIALPVYLAFTVSMTYLLLYVLYLVILVLLSVAVGDKNDDDGGDDNENS